VSCGLDAPPARAALAVAVPAGDQQS
jgi:hypothetical protein